MTENKPIMIDGVDMSEYMFYKGYCRIASLCDYTGHLCECTPNCHFKQLTRKTQECEELNTDNIYLRDRVGKLERVILRRNEQIDQLETAKEQAEQKLERIREIAKQMNNECFYDDFECKDCDMKNGCTYFNKSKILQIINEVE